MKESMRVERLRQLRRVLLKIARAQAQHLPIRIGGTEIEFDMNTFMDVDPECGTSCCALGACTFDPWFRRRGLTRTLSGTPRYRGYRALEAGAEFFGLDSFEASALFLNSALYASDVVRILDDVIARKPGDC